jgi:oligopeptidase B
MHRT